MWKCLSCGASTPKSCTCGRVNGEPAFPCETPNEIFSGLTMRDYFASKAMVGMTNQLNRIHADVFNGYDNPGALRVLADAAYQVADAMLKARG